MCILINLPIDSNIKSANYLVSDYEHVPCSLCEKCVCVADTLEAFR